MQDRTIDNALLALHRRGGDQADLARAILALRGIPLPHMIHDRPLSRGACRRLVLECLPCTSTVLADRIQERLPGISRKSACQRAYMALRRLEEAGKVRREGRAWTALT